MCLDQTDYLCVLRISQRSALNRLGRHFFDDYNKLFTKLLDDLARTEAYPWFFSNLKFREITFANFEKTTPWWYFSFKHNIQIYLQLKINK